MADKDGAGTGAVLVISGPDPGQECKHPLREGVVVRVGRAPALGLSIPWDKAISREQADLVWRDGRLNVVCVKSARNPAIFRKKLTRDFSLAPGETFIIGESRFALVASGRSPTRDATIELPRTESESGTNPTFKLADDKIPSLAESSFQSEVLAQVAFSNPAKQIEILARLPRLIAAAPSDVDLAVMLTEQLLEAIPHALAVAAVQFDENEVQHLRDAEVPEEYALADPLTVRVQRRQRFGGRFTPSRRLLQRALTSNETVLHIWEGRSEAELNFTRLDDIGWAFCVPVVGEASLGWCLYVAGSGSPDGKFCAKEEGLRGDMRFTELVAQFIASVRQVRTLQEQATQLSAFFSPKVIRNLMKRGNSELMAPSERDITVLFCDVRGFTRKSEQLQGDLPKLLTCVRAALGAMTGGILAFDGAVADYQGDSALGFWGWPVPLPDGPLSACHAAFTIQTLFGLPDEQGLLDGFTAGLGIAYGRGIAGQIGTATQAKIGVFGPVVNRGSRLEGMTRMFGVAICIDDATASFVRRMLPVSEGRCRRLARVRPWGMQNPIEVSELLPSVEEAPHVTPDMIARHEMALDSIIAGTWSDAIDLLRMQPDNDGPAKFLLAEMKRTNFHPPDDWDGAFRLQSK